MIFDLVKDGGADPTGASDSTAAWREAASVALQADLSAPRGRYSIRDTVAFEHMHGVKAYGEGTTGETYGVQLAWDGLAGGTVLLLNQIRDSSFDDIAIVPGANPFAIGLDVDEIGPVPPGQITTNLWLKRIVVRNPDVAGFRFAKTAPNNTDLFQLEGCGTVAWGLHKADGIQMWNVQSKMHRIIGGGFAGCANGIHTPGGGSFTAIGVNYSDNLIDNYLERPSDTIAFFNPQSEGAGRFLKTENSGTCWPIGVFGGRLSLSKMAADGKFIDYRQRGTLRLDTVGFDASGSAAPASFTIALGTNVGGDGSTCLATGCGFPNQRPFSGVFTTASAMLGCMYVDSTGHAWPLKNNLAGLN